MREFPQTKWLLSGVFGFFELFFNGHFGACLLTQVLLPEAPKHVMKIH